MMPISLTWDSREKSILIKWDGFFSVLPVSKISLGIGAGGGAKTEQTKTSGGSGGAGGGGICVEPIAFLVIKDGEVSILNLRRMPAMVEAFFGKIPDMVEKTVDILRGKKKGEGSGPKG